MDTKLLPAFMCNIASRVVWLRQAIEQDPELKKVAGKLARYTARMEFEDELLSGRMDQVQKVVDEITKDNNLPLQTSDAGKHACPKCGTRTDFSGSCNGCGQYNLFKRIGK